MWSIPSRETAREEVFWSLVVLAVVLLMRLFEFTKSLLGFMKGLLRFIKSLLGFMKGLLRSSGP
jgi:hypothetical protein